MALLLVALAMVAAYRLRHRITRRARALVLVAAILGFNVALGAPATAQVVVCGEAPPPERPGAGMVGRLDPPHGQGEADTPYQRYGYAGMVWHTYNADCGLSTSASLSTWLGNQFFDVAKLFVGATNALHYDLLDGPVIGGLNAQIRKAGDNVFGYIFEKFSTLFLLVLATHLLVVASRGYLAETARRAFLAVVGMWLAAASLTLVAFYGYIDNVIVDFTVGVQAGFVNPSSRDLRDKLPTKLHTTIVYDNWLRGEFGNDFNSPKAREFGPQLLDAQAWTVEETHSGRDTDPNAENAKKDQYRQIATQVGSSTDTFTGNAGTRIGTGFLALLQAVAYTLFPLLAQIWLIIGQVLLRLLTMTGPIIGLVAIINPGVLRKFANTAGTIVVLVFVLAILSGVYTKLLDLITSDQARIPLGIQFWLAWMITGTFLTPVIVGLVLHRRRTKTKQRNKTQPAAAQTENETREEEQPTAETQTNTDQSPPQRGQIQSPRPEVQNLLDDSADDGRLTNGNKGFTPEILFGPQPLQIETGTAVPHGFSTLADFRSFGSMLRSGLLQAGYHDATPIIQGSAIWGTKYKDPTKDKDPTKAFDEGKRSDFDIAIASSTLFDAAIAAGIKLRTKGSRTGPLTSRELRILGLKHVRGSLSSSVGRKVRFMLYCSTDAVFDFRPGITVP